MRRDYFYLNNTALDWNPQGIRNRLALTLGRKLHAVGALTHWGHYAKKKFKCGYRETMEYLYSWNKVVNLILKIYEKSSLCTPLTSCQVALPWHKVSLLLQYVQQKGAQWPYSYPGTYFRESRYRTAVNKFVIEEGTEKGRRPRGLANSGRGFIPTHVSKNK